MCDVTHVLNKRTKRSNSDLLFNTTIHNKLATMVSVPAPAPFLPCSGEPAIPFVTWGKIFENYLIAINATGDAWPDARKRAILLHSLGTEGQRLFYTYCI